MARTSALDMHSTVYGLLLLAGDLSAYVSIAGPDTFTAAQSCGPSTAITTLANTLTQRHKTGLLCHVKQTMTVAVSDATLESISSLLS